MKKSGVSLKLDVLLGDNRPSAPPPPPYTRKSDENKLARETSRGSPTACNSNVETFRDGPVAPRTIEYTRQCKKYFF